MRSSSSVGFRAGGRVDKGSRRVGEGPQPRPAHIHKDDISPLAHLQRAGNIAEAEGFGAVLRTAEQRLRRGQTPRLARRAFMRKREQRKLAKHVEDIVARSAVGAHAEVDAGLKQRRHRREAVAQLHVAGRVGDNADAAFGQYFDILGAELRAVGGQSGNGK